MTFKREQRSAKWTQCPWTNLGASDPKSRDSRECILQRWWQQSQEWHKQPQYLLWTRLELLETVSMAGLQQQCACQTSQYCWQFWWWLGSSLPPSAWFINLILQLPWWFRDYPVSSLQITVSVQVTRTVFCCLQPGSWLAMLSASCYTWQIPEKQFTRQKVYFRGPSPWLLALFFGPTGT